jgi:hypothetical protein
MRYFLLFIAFFAPLFFASFVSAQDCPSNTSSTCWARTSNVSGVCGTTGQAACNAYAVLYQDEDGQGTFIPSATVPYAYGNCTNLKNQYDSPISPLSMKNYGYFGDNDLCQCLPNQLATTNGSGEIIGCSDIATVPETCSNSQDQLAGQCGSAPADCAASGGSFGWVNNVPTCVPADWAGEDGSGTPDCGTGILVFGAVGSEGSFSCSGGDSSDPTDPTDPTDPPDDGTDGGGGSGDGSSSPPETGGSKFIDDPEDSTRPQIEVSCNPFSDSSCTETPDLTSNSAGQCDPEAINYESCIKSSQVANAATSCASPPVCTGDSIQCAVLLQDFNLQCSVNVSGTEQCATFSCTGNPIFCESLRLKSLANCEAFKATRSAVISDLDAFGVTYGLVSIDDLEARNNAGYRGVGDFESIDISDDLPPEYIEQFAGSCTLSLTSDLGTIGGTVSLQESEICSLASNIRPFVLFSAYLFSALFIGRIVGGAL